MNAKFSHTGAASKMIGFIFAALLLPASASAGSLHLPTAAPLVVHEGAPGEFSANLSNSSSRWSDGATSEWNAGMNRAVDRIVSPPANVNVYAGQARDNIGSNLEATHGANGTLAGFKIVFH